MREAKNIQIMNLERSKMTQRVAKGCRKGAEREVQVTDWVSKVIKESRLASKGR